MDHPSPGTNFRGAPAPDRPLIRMLSSLEARMATASSGGRAARRGLWTVLLVGGQGAAGLGLAGLGYLAAPETVSAQERPAVSEATVQASQPRRLRLDVEGVSGAARDNVLATVRAARTGDRQLTEGEVRSLAGRAPGEVAAALAPFGYYETTTEITQRLDGNRWRMTLTVSPGPQTQYARVDIRLLGPASSDPELNEWVRSTAPTVGSPFIHSAYELLKVGMSRRAFDRGYLEASFDSAVVRVDRGRRTAEVALHLRSGQRYRLGPVTFQQDVLDPEVLQQLVPWDVGDEWRPGALVELQNAVTAGPYFASVEVVPRRDLATDLVVPVEVVTTPAPSQRYSIGGGYGSDTGPRASGSVEFRRLNRLGHRAEVEAWVALVERTATARYILPMRFRKASVATISAGYVDESPETSDTQTWISGLSVAGLWGAWRGEVSLTAQRATFEVADQSGIVRLLLAGVGVTRVRADDRIDPMRGSMLRLRARAGEDSFIGTVRLLEAGLEARIVRSPWERVRLRARTEVAALTTPDFNRLPGSIRYFAGGDRSIRGYGYEALGPQNADGDVIGGRRMVTGSLEAEYRLFESWGIAAFVDGGNAFNSFSDPLEFGSGAGVRWLAPIGMVRLDGAFAISTPGRPFRLHLTLGPEL